MKVQLKKLSEKAKEVQIEANKILFKTTKFGVNADSANHVIYVYTTDYEVTIPEGYIGMLQTTEEIAVKSLIMAASPVILVPGKHLIAGILKPVNATIPSLFTENETTFQLTLVQSPTIDELEIEEYVEPVVEVQEEPSTDEQITEEMTIADTAANESLN